jgi:hypothetical protein
LAGLFFKYWRNLVKEEEMYKYNTVVLWCSGEIQVFLDLGAKSAILFYQVLSENQQKFSSEIVFLTVVIISIIVTITRIIVISMLFLFVYSGGSSVWCDVSFIKLSSLISRVCCCSGWGGVNYLGSNYNTTTKDYLVTITTRIKPLQCRSICKG